MTVTPLMLLLVLANLFFLVLNCFRAGEQYTNSTRELSGLLVAAIIFNFLVLGSFIMAVSLP
jgi:hypothetical protein